MLLYCCGKMQRNKRDLHIYYFETVTMCYFCCVDKEKANTHLFSYFIAWNPSCVFDKPHITCYCPSSVARRGTKSFFLFLKSSWTPSIRPFHTNCDNELSVWVVLQTFFLIVLCSSLPGTPLSHCFLQSHLPWAGHQTRPSAVPPNLDSVILLNVF